MFRRYCRRWPRGKATSTNRLTPAGNGSPGEKVHFSTPMCTPALRVQHSARSSPPAMTSRTQTSAAAPVSHLLSLTLFACGRNDGEVAKLPRDVLNAICLNVFPSVEIPLLKAALITALSCRPGSCNMLPFS